MFEFKKALGLQNAILTILISAGNTGGGTRLGSSAVLGELSVIKTILGILGW